MAKQPYIPFYLGDYIKDTRVLPLNVKGGWVDLILAMWDNDPKGELIGTMDDFARIMNCPKDEAILVIQTLKQKKLFDYDDLVDGFMKIISRKQKKMNMLSEIRKNVGKTGGNPNLVKQKDKYLDNQKGNQNTEYENEFKDKNINKEDFVKNLVFDDVRVGSAIEYLKITKQKTITPDQVQVLWECFKQKEYQPGKFFKNEDDIYTHFFNSLKYEKFNEPKKEYQHPDSTKVKIKVG